MKSTAGLGFRFEPDHVYRYSFELRNGFRFGGSSYLLGFEQRLKKKKMRRDGVYIG
jgi:hypothetical protein